MSKMNIIEKVAEWLFEGGLLPNITMEYGWDDDRNEHKGEFRKQARSLLHTLGLTDTQIKALETEDTRLAVVWKDSKGRLPISEYDMARQLPDTFDGSLIPEEYQCFREWYLGYAVPITKDMLSQGWVKEVGTNPCLDCKSKEDYCPDLPCGKKEIFDRKGEG